MSNDLINRQNAIENIWSIFNNTYSDASRFEAEEMGLARKVLVDVQRMIESQPTAYDVDKVVEQIESSSTDKDGIVCYVDKKPVITKEVAIKIIKSGGIE